jgi:hypothetical protein
MNKRPTSTSTASVASPTYKLKATAAMPTIYFENDPVWRVKEAGRIPPTKNNAKSTYAMTTHNNTNNIMAYASGPVAVVGGSDVVSCPLVDQLCQNFAKIKISY